MKTFIQFSHSPSNSQRKNRYSSNLLICYWAVQFRILNKRFFKYLCIIIDFSTLRFHSQRILYLSFSYKAQQSSLSNLKMFSIVQWFNQKILVGLIDHRKKACMNLNCLEWIFLSIMENAGERFLLKACWLSTQSPITNSKNPKIALFLKTYLNCYQIRKVFFRLILVKKHYKLTMLCTYKRYDIALQCGLE